MSNPPNNKPSTSGVVPQPPEPFFAWRRHWAYLKYIARHKFYVYQAGRIYGLPLWRCLLHDWHKFLPSEWRAYANTFYDARGKTRYLQNNPFARAWLYHQNRGRHHWQFWILAWDTGQVETIAMPPIYVKEMVADWWGTGRTITGKWCAPAWYAKNRSNIMLHSQSRELAETLLMNKSPQFHLRNSPHIQLDLHATKTPTTPAV